MAFLCQLDVKKTSWSRVMVEWCNWFPRYRISRAESSLAYLPFTFPKRTTCPKKCPRYFYNYISFQPLF